MDLKTKPYQNLSETAQVGIAKFIDAGKNDAMGNERRPGLGCDSGAYFVSLATGCPVTTLYEWESQNVCVAISNGRIFKILRNGFAIEITGATLNLNNIASFADFGSTLFIANGGAIVKWVISSNTCTFIADTDAPRNVTHIGFIDQYLMALDSLTDRIYFAEVADPDNWLGEFFTAESLKDKSQALHIGWREVTIFGSSSIEYWVDTGSATAPFQRNEGANTERGCIAPYSIQKIDNTWFFLDHERNVVKLAGRDPIVLSSPFAREIASMDTVADAVATHIHCDGETWYVLSFPAERRTFAYDYKRDYWAEWSYWDTASGTRSHWLGISSCYMRAWNKHLVGSRLDGKIYEVSKDYYRDGTNPMMLEIWTGWEGDGQWRMISEMLLKLRRGDGAALDEPEPWMEVWYRNRDANPNDTDNAWIGPKHINLGQLGEMDHFFRIRRLGRYRNRQYRFRCSANIPVVLMEAQEL